MKRSILISAKLIWNKPTVRLLVSLCILGLLLFNIPLFDLWDTIRNISPFLWIGVVIAFLIGHLAGVIKWCLFINVGESTLCFFRAAQCYFAGLFANLFLPSLAGGDVIRAGLAIRYRADKGAVIIGGLLDRFLDVCALGFIMLVTALYSQTSLSVEYSTVLFSILVSMIIFVLGIALVLKSSRLKFIPGSIDRRLEPFRDVIRRLMRGPKSALGALTISLSIQSGFILLNAVLGMACGIDLPIYVWFIAWPLAKLSAMLPISLGGLGVRETALAFLLLKYDIPFAKSVGLGLMWESVLIAGGIVGGGAYLLSRKDDASAEISIEKTCSTVHDVVN